MLFYRQVRLSLFIDVVIWAYMLYFVGTPITAAHFIAGQYVDLLATTYGDFLVVIFLIVFVGKIKGFRA